MARTPVVVSMLAAAACGGGREVARPRSGAEDVIALAVPPACSWKGRTCYDSRASCLLAEKTRGITDPTACSERDEVACFRIDLDLPDTVCSPSVGDCEIARARLLGTSNSRASECFVMRYAP